MWNVANTDFYGLNYCIYIILINKNYFDQKLYDFVLLIMNFVFLYCFNGIVEIIDMFICKCVCYTFKKVQRFVLKWFLIAIMVIFSINNKIYLVSITIIYKIMSTIQICKKFLTCFLKDHVTNLLLQNILHDHNCPNFVYFNCWYQIKKKLWMN